MKTNIPSSADNAASQDENCINYLPTPPSHLSRAQQPDHVHFTPPVSKLSNPRLPDITSNQLQLEANPPLRATPQCHQLGIRLYPSTSILPSNDRDLNKNAVNPNVPKLMTVNRSTQILVHYSFVVAVQPSCGLYTFTTPSFFQVNQT